MKNKGFTLIELLIVITLLGILAVAVLSAINPVEQMNRSRDTSTRSDAEQLINAVDRYYATKGFYPWQTSADPTISDPTLPFTEVRADWIENGGDDSVLGKLSSGGAAEIKESFVSRIDAEGYNHLWIYNDGKQGSSTYACFIPKSSSFKDDAWYRCSGQGDFGELPADFPVTEACPGDCTNDDLGATPDGCYSCLP
ncbi:MAG: type II secretion system protein [Patescibacteria group bacterium]|jgi:prepilin-type N-terminal cleavage/methylation domain-containing protein